MAMSQAKSVFSTKLDEAEEARLDAVADAEIDAGKGVSHEKVRAWLETLVKGERSLLPSA